MIEQYKTSQQGSQGACRSSFPHLISRVPKCPTFADYQHTMGSVASRAWLLGHLVQGVLYDAFCAK